MYFHQSFFSNFNNISIICMTILQKSIFSSNYSFLFFISFKCVTYFLKYSLHQILMDVPSYFKMCKCFLKIMRKLYTYDIATSQDMWAMISMTNCSHVVSISQEPIAKCFFFFHKLFSFFLVFTFLDILCTFVFFFQFASEFKKPQKLPKK